MQNSQHEIFANLKFQAFSLHVMFMNFANLFFLMKNMKFNVVNYLMFYSDVLYYKTAA